VTSDPANHGSSSWRRQVAHQAWTSPTNCRPPIASSFIVDSGLRSASDALLPVLFCAAVAALADDVAGGSSVSSKFGRFLLPARHAGIKKPRIREIREIGFILCASQRPDSGADWLFKPFLAN